MSLHHDRLRAQHGHPLHRDHTEDLETGIASAVREIDEMRAALDRVRALTYASDDGGMSNTSNLAVLCDTIDRTLILQLDDGTRTLLSIDRANHLIASLSRAVDILVDTPAPDTDTEAWAGESPLPIHDVDVAPTISGATVDPERVTADLWADRDFVSLGIPIPQLGIIRQLKVSIPRGPLLEAIGGQS